MTPADYGEGVALAKPDQPITDVGPALPAFSVIDIETSGLSTRRHRILQLAVARVEQGAIADEWTSLVRLRWPWQRVGPRQVHGLTRAQLRDAPSADVALTEFASRVSDTVLVAHNVRFDWPFIDRAARRAHIPVSPARLVCTLRLSRRLDPDRELSHRLSDLCARYGVDNARPHDALSDARATALVLPHLLRAHEIESAGQLEPFYETGSLR